MNLQKKKKCVKNRKYFDNYRNIDDSDELSEVVRNMCYKLNNANNKNNG